VSPKDHASGVSGVGSGRFVAAVMRATPARLGWLTFVQVVAALTQGLGLILLLPLLEAAGVAPSSASAGLVGAIRNGLQDFGLSPTLQTMLVVYVVIVTVAGGLGAYQTFLLSRFSLEFVDRLRSRLYRAMAAAEWKRLLGFRQSDTLTVLTVNSTSVASGTHSLLGLGAAMIVLPVQIAVALRISPIVTSLVAATTVCLSLLLWPFLVWSRRLGREFVDNNRAVLATVTGFLDGLKLAKAHGLQDSHVGQFDTALRRSRNSTTAFVKAQALAGVAQLTLTALVLAVSVDIAITRMGLPVAEMLVLAVVFVRVVPQISSALQNVQLVSQALPAFGEIVTAIESCEKAQEDVTTADDVADIPRLTGPGLRFDGVRFAYPLVGGGAREVLHGVSFEVLERRTTALVGPSGAGKSTLADLAVGLLTPSAGQVTVGGATLVGDRLRSWRSVVGLVPQDPFLFHDTIRSNLCWAQPSATDDDIWAALTLAAARNFVADLPQSLETVVGDRGARLSGGERQRLALARALLRQPELLILDEATSSLDTEHELAIREALGSLHGRLTILVIAHRLSTVSHADEIVVVDQGRVVELGSWAELSDRPDGRLRSLIDAGAVA
jgi:ATP-binding cassette subfamily C protein